MAAARALIDAGFKAVELRDFAERLTRIEERLSDVPAHPRLVDDPPLGETGS